MGYYRTPSDILNDMLAGHLYYTGLAGAPVKLSPTDYGRDEVIKYLNFAGALSQFTATLDQVSADFFPGSASEPALEKHLARRGLPAREDAQPATVQIERTGTPGTEIDQGDQMVRSTDATFWELQATITIGDDGTAVGTYESVQDGQDQNSDETGEVYTAVTATAGVSSTGTSTTAAQDGRDQETPAEMLSRIQAFDQQPNTGGNLVWYEQTARAASPAVTGAVSTHSGPGAVQTVITSGTTDIMEALQNNQAIERIPSDDLLATVQAAIVAANPTTDTHTTIAPTEVNFDLTFNYDLYDETQRSTVDAQIQILLKFFIYTMVPDETYFPTDVERLIQGQLGYLIRAMRAQNLGGGAVAYTLPATNLAKPGTITTGTWS